MSESKPTVERPEYCTDEMLEYLDFLRQSGVTTMFGAAPYLEKEFEAEFKATHKSFHSSDKARAVLTYWMKTFRERR